MTLLANKEGLDLTDLARDIAASYKADLGPGTTSDDIVSQESKYPVDETVSHLQAVLKAAGVPVFAVFDHGKNAQKVEMQLRPTKVVVFGNPKVGTKLMQDSQAAGLDLPLRLSIWQDGRGRVWLSRHSLESLTREYGIKDAATVRAMERMLEGVVSRTANVYDY